MPENKIYGFLKENQLTDLDEAAWVDKYSDPVKAKEVYSFFKDNALTDLDEISFSDKYLKKKEVSAPSSGDFAQNVSAGLGLTKPKLPLQSQSAKPSGDVKANVDFIKSLASKPNTPFEEQKAKAQVKQTGRMKALEDRLNTTRARNEITKTRLAEKPILNEAQQVLTEQQKALEELSAVINDVNQPIAVRQQAQNEAAQLYPVFEKGTQDYNNASANYNQMLNEEKVLLGKQEAADKAYQYFGKDYNTWKNFAEKTGKAFVDMAAGGLNIANTIGLTGDTESTDADEQELIKEQVRAKATAIEDFGKSLLTEERYKPEDYRSLFKGEFSGAKLLDLTLEAAASTIPTVTAGLVTGGVGAGVAGASMMFNESRDILEETGLDEGKSEAVALALSIPLGLLEKVGADDAIRLFRTAGAKKLITEVGEEVAKKGLTKAAAFELTQKELGKFLMTEAKNLGKIGKSGLKEAATEAAQGEVNEIAKQIAQEVTGVDTDENMATSDYLQEQLLARADEAVGGFLGGTGLTGAGQVVNRVMSYKATPTGYARAMELRNPEVMADFEQDLSQEVEQGITTPQQAEEAIKNVAKIQEADSKIPDTIIEDEARTEALNLVMEKTDLEQQIEGKDKALIAPVVERIAEIDAQLGEIATGKFTEKLIQDEQAKETIEETEQGEVTDVGLRNEPATPITDEGGAPISEAEPISVEETVIAETENSKQKATVYKTETVQSVQNVKKNKKKTALKELDPKEEKDFIALALHGSRVKSDSFINKRGKEHITPQMRLTYLSPKGTPIDVIASDLKREGGVFESMDEADIEEMIADYMVENPAGARQYANRRREDFEAEQLRYDEEARAAEQYAMELEEAEREAYYQELNEEWETIEDKIDNLTDEDFAKIQSEFSEGLITAEEILTQIKNEKTTDKSRTKVGSEKESSRTVSERKKIAEAEVREVAEKLKTLLRPKTFNESDKTSGINQDKIIDLIADAVVGLVNTGIDLQEAIKQVRDILEADFDTSGISDEDIKAKLPKTDKSESDKAKTDQNNQSKEKSPKETKLQKNYQTAIEHIQNLPEKVIDYMKGNPLSYEVVSRAEDLQAARKYIIEQGEVSGEPVAYTKYMAGEIGGALTMSQKVGVGYLLRGAISEQFNEASEKLKEAKTIEEAQQIEREIDLLWDRINTLSNKLSSDANDMGRGVSMYALFAQNLTDDVSALFYFGRLVSKMADASKNKNKPRASKARNTVKTQVNNGVKQAAKNMANNVVNNPPPQKVSKLSEAKEARDKAYTGLVDAFSKYRVIGIAHNPYEEFKKDKEAVKSLVNYVKAEAKYKSVQVQQIIKLISEQLNIDSSLIDAKEIEVMVNEANAEAKLAAAEKRSVEAEVKKEDKAAEAWLPENQLKAQEEKTSKLAKELLDNPQAIEKTFEEIIEDFYKGDFNDAGLVQLIKDRLFVSEIRANELANQLKEELRKNVTERLEKTIGKEIDKSSKKAKKPVNKKDVYKTLIQAHMMKVLDDNTIQDLIPSMFNVPKMTKEDVLFVKDIMGKVQKTADPTRKAELLNEMIKRFHNKAPVSMADVYDKFWYANVLSGLSTLNVNIAFGENIFNFAYLVYAAQGAMDIANSVFSKKDSVKNSAKRFVQGLWRSFQQLGTVGINDVFKKDTYKKWETLPMYETFANVMSVLKHGNEVYMEELKGLDYNKSGDFRLQELTKSENKAWLKTLAGFNAYVKGVPRVLNAVDLAFSTGIKNLYMTPILTDYYKSKGFTGDELQKKVENDIFNTDIEVAEAQQKAKADRLNIDLSIEQVGDKWVVTDKAAKVWTKKVFNNKYEAQSYMDEQSQSGVKYRKGVMDYLNAKLPQEAVKSAKKIASKYVLTGEPEGSLGLAYDKVITSIKVMLQRAYQNDENMKLGRAAAFALDKMLVFLRVPFNMTNLALDTTPLGGLRAWKGGIFSDYKRAEMTATEKRIILSAVLIGSIQLGLMLVEQDIIKSEDDDEKEKDERKKLAEDWNKSHPDDLRKATDPLFDLPKDGELFGSLNFLNPNEKKFLLTNGLAAEFSEYNEKTGKWISYLTSPFILQKAAASSISNYDKYIIQDKTKFNDAAERRKELGETIKWSVAAMGQAYLNLSGMKTQQQIFTAFGKTDDTFVNNLADAVTSGIQVNPAIVRQSVANFDGVMRERIQFMEQPLDWTAQKFLPIFGSFVKGKKRYDMFGDEMPLVYGSEKGGLLEVAFDKLYSEKEKKRTELAQWMHENGYNKFRDFASENKNKRVAAYVDGSPEFTRLFEDEKRLEEVGVEAAKLAKKTILDNKQVLNELAQTDKPNLALVPDNYKLPFFKGVDAIFAATFRYKFMEEANKKGYLSDEAFKLEKIKFDLLPINLMKISLQTDVEPDIPIEGLKKFGYLE